jgi:preprotein translocase subunit SecF
MKLSVIKNRNIWFTFSGLLVAASIVGLFMFGLNFGIDFAGGSLMEASFGTADVASVKATVVDFSEINSVQVQPTNENTFIIRFNYINNDTHTHLLTYLKDKFPSFEELRFETIGPVIGEDLKNKAFMSLLISIAFIIMFVAFAFRKIPQSMSSWKFGMVAVVALIHDVLITIGVFSFLGFFMSVEIDSLFVTALLTVMGWSVNDTIVVFDRIRENIIKNRRVSFAESADKSIDETAVRSVNTSLTTLLTLLALFFFAGASIKFFVLALIVGIIIGTYSSIFLATPLLVVWQESLEVINEAIVEDSSKKLNDGEDLISEESKKRKKANKKRKGRR